MTLRLAGGVTFRRTVLAALCGGLLGLPLVVAPSSAQTPEELRRQAERALGRPISDQEILRRLRESGLTSEEIRRRLEAAGFERTAADPYLAVLAGAADAVPQGTNPMPLVQLLAGVEEMRRLGRVPADRPLPPEVREEPPGLPIFGRELFRRATSQFQPVMTGPVPPDYRLGPGDRVVLVLTGGVEQAYELTVTREGWIVIPDVGRVLVNGLTLEALEEVLFNRLSQVYSGIRPGPEATTFFDVTIGELRTNQVYVVGEVEEPSAYAVSSLATALTGLYWAGGPNVNGSFREILVNRGGRTVARIDLYDYLLRGDASRDVRLEQGDIVFVPVAERRVAVDGAVMRPGLYELKEGETLAEAIRFAGGLQPQADLRRVQISRILPPEQRAPGVDRAILDVSLGSAEEGTAVSLRAGDEVTVFAVLEEAQNWVTVSGGVWRPGQYAAEPGTRLWDVIERAGGLLPDAYEGRAQIQRLREDDWTRRMVQVSLARGGDGAPLENPELRGMDQVFVFPKRELREGRVVSIGGWVRRPGVYPHAEGMTLRDLVLQAGGLRMGAFLGHAEVSRVLVSQAHTDTLTRRFQVPLDSTYVFDTVGEGLAAGRAGSGGGDGARAGDGDGDGAGDGARGGAGAPVQDAAEVGAEAGAAGRVSLLSPRNEFPLRNLDAVFIRRAPGFVPQQNVVVTGEILLPGPYSLQTRSERLTDLVQRAGGLTPEAYPEGLQLWRAGPEMLPDTLTPAEIAGRVFGDTLTAEEEARLREVGEGRERFPQDRFPGDRVPGDRVPGRLEDRREAGEAPERRRVERQVPRTRVGVDFVQALRRPDGPHNILVEPNDSIFVPRFIPTVDVRGAVEAPTRVLYRRGAGLNYYIDQAGGYAENALKSRTRVRYANGEVRTRGGKFLFFGGGVPAPDPGSVITVPEKAPREPGGFRITELVGIMASIATAAATVIIATQ